MCTYNLHRLTEQSCAAVAGWSTTLALLVASQRGKLCSSQKGVQPVLVDAAMLASLAVLSQQSVLALLLCGGRMTGMAGKNNEINGWRVLCQVAGTGRG